MGLPGRELPGFPVYNRGLEITVPTVNAWIETPARERIPIQGTCYLGRGSSNTVALPGEMISRRHALIHRQGGSEHWLVDLGSSNGVLLNGRRVKHPMALKDQDRIEIGASTVVYRQAAQAAPQTEETETETAFRPTSKAQKTLAIWMLIADIKKFTLISQKLPGDRLAKLVGRWIAACKEVIEQNGGEIYQYLGDGFMAYWQVDSTPVEAIARTLAELKKIQATCPPPPRVPEELEAWMDKLAAGSRVPFRLVVHTGNVTLDHTVADGDIGLIGPPMNFVFRMEKLAGLLGLDCLASEAAAEQLKQFGTLTPQGHHSLSGFAGTHPMFAG